MSKTKEKIKSAANMVSNSFFILKFAYKANKFLYFVKIPLMVFTAFYPYISMIFIRLLLNEITVGRSMQKIIFYAVALAVSILICEIIINILSYFDRYLTEKTVGKMKVMLGEAVMKIPYSELEQPKIKDFVMLAQGGNTFLTVISNLTLFSTALLKVIGLASIIITVEPAVFLLIVAVVVLRTLNSKKIRALVRQWRATSVSMQRNEDYFKNVMKETEFGKEIRINQLGDWIFDKYKDFENNVYLPKLYGFNLKRQKLNGLNELVGAAQEGIIYLLLAYKVVFKNMLIGDFSLYLTSIQSFAESVQGIIGSSLLIMQNGLFTSEFRYCMELATQQKEEEKKDFPLDMESFSLEFRHVYFQYPNTDRLILKDISFTLASRETLSIIGINGAGKTTLVKLICRLYEPTSGEILLNGMPIQEIPIGKYNRLLSVVFQDFKLFSFSFGENIYLDTEYDERKLGACIEQSGLESRVQSLPKGIFSMINKQFDENGIELSGGEGQKLAIARALYKDAPMIILDEPTSALDPVAEYEMYRHFDNLVKGRTAIYISHRLSSTRFTDKIAVLSEGRLVEYGNHRELIGNKDGLYSKMFTIQAENYQ